MKKSLFREEALRASRGKWLGEILLASPLNIRVLVGCAAAFFIACVVLLCSASYTRHGVVSGVLVPEGGVIKIFAPQPGLVSQRLVSEGEVVRKGQLLYVISSERRATRSSMVQSSITEQARIRRKSLAEELERIHSVHQEEQTALGKKIKSLNDAADNLADQIGAQKSGVRISENLWNRYKELLLQGYISNPQVEEKEQAMIEQKNRLRNLEYNLITALSEIDERKSELRTLSAKQEAVIGQLQRNLTLADQELIESEAKRELMIVAPESGIATGVFSETGQAVDATRPLLGIARNLKLQIRLYVPSKSVAHVQTGTKIRVRYAAFPYQRFGLGNAVVTSVSHTAFSASELAAMGASPSSTNPEPMYIIDADIVKNARAKSNFSERLRAGMQVEAELKQETHTLIEWLFAPLRTLRTST